MFRGGSILCRIKEYDFLKMVLTLESNISNFIVPVSTIFENIIKRID